MRDVATWEALHAESPAVDDVLALLDELGQAPLARRALFLPAVLPFTTHRAPRVRAAAVSALAGCLGVEGRRAIAARLDDNHGDVRRAAVDALGACCVADDAPFACALFHRRVDVRRRAIACAPPRVPFAHLVLLLARDEHEDDVRAMLDRRGEEGAVALGLLAARRHSLLPDDEVCARLSRVPWGRSPAECLAGLPFPAVADAHLATPEALKTYLTSLRQTDPLADVLALLWGAGAGEAGLTDAAPIVDELVAARRAGRLKDAEHRRVAAAAALVMLSRGASSPRMLALCALAAPAVLLLEENAARRRAALVALVDVAGAEQGGRATSLKSLVERRVLVDAAGAVDLAAVSGALRLVADAPYQKLREVIPTADVVTAFWAACARGLPPVELVSLAPRSPGDREAYRALVRGIVEGMRTAAPEVIAALSLAMPAEGGFILAEIEKRRAGLAGRSLALLLADARPSLDDIGLRRLERNAALLAAQLTAASLPVALATAARVLRSPSSAAASPPVALAAAHAVLRAGTRPSLAAAVAELPPATVRELAAVLDDIVLPVDVERQWAAALAGSKVPEALAWALPRVEAKDAPRPIGEGLKANIATASDERVPLLTSVFLREPLTGIVEALAARPGIPASARLCAALLASHDPPHQVAALFQRALKEEPPFLSAIDQALLDATTEDGARRDLPLLATAWVHHDAAQAVRFEQHCRTAPGGLRSVFELALALPSPFLSWKIVRALVEVVRAWTFQRKALLDKLDARLAEIVVAVLARKVGPRPPAQATSTFHGARAVRRLAAELVAVAHGSGKAADFIAEVRQRLLDEEPVLDSDLRAILRPFLVEIDAWSPPPVRAPAREPARDRLRAFDAHVARAAVDELTSQGPVGRRAIVDVLCAPAPPLCARAIVERTILDDEMAARLLAPDVDPEIRFRVALRVGRDDVAVAAAAAPSPRPWLGADDLAALSARVPSRPLALHLARSPHQPAFSKALWTLLSIWHDERATDARQGLLDFLAAGDERDESLRAEAAAALLEGGVLVAPVVLRTVVAPTLETRHDQALRAAVPLSLWREVIRGAAIAGDRALDERLQALLEKRLVDDDVGAVIALHLLKGGVDKDEAGPLFAAMRRARRADDPRIEELREAVQWGIRQSRVLLGRPVSVEFIHDAFGYTRLHQPRIFINPLPLLQNERGGDDVVRGLMVHEIGHHLYHSDELGRQCWAAAQKEGLGSLLNLVADEHLERNLRATSEVYGDHLKVLAAYAFQHLSRDVWLEQLLNHLGRHAAFVLAGARLEPGAHLGSVHVELGKLLAEMAGETSFARFMRALRMGLGGRGAETRAGGVDDKVKTALALFEKKQFRQSKMDWLLEIARELARIFGDETRILDTFGLHETLEAGEGELIEEGFSPDELKRETEPRPGKRRGKIEKPRFNDSPEERFDLIDQVVPLTHDPAAHRALAAQGRRATRALRELFDELGLRMVSEHRHLSGRSIDRQGLGSAVLKRDPRLLVRRTPVPAADLFVGIVVDCSGSMASERSLDKARVFATSLAEAARGTRGVDVRVFGFTDQVLYEAGDADRCAAHALTAGGGNNDAAALWHAAVQARRSRRRSKLLVMVSDGLPTECSATALRSLASRLERGGLLTAQVAVRPIGEKMFKHYVEILGDDIDDAARRFARTMSKLVRKTVGR